MGTGRSSQHLLTIFCLYHEGYTSRAVFLASPESQGTRDQAGALTESEHQGEFAEWDEQEQAGLEAMAFESSFLIRHCPCRQA